MRRLTIALDALGIILLAGGLTGLAYLAHPYLAAVVLGLVLIAAGWLLEPRAKVGRE